MKTIGLKKLLYKNAPFFVFLMSFLVMLPAYNKFWAPYDEGFILEASYMANENMVPYRDFFILLYPPGQIYMIALLFKIFGTNLLIPRIYTIFMQSVLCAAVFYISGKIVKVRYAVIGTVILLSALASHGGSIPRPMWPGAALSIISIAFFINFIESRSKHYLILAGFFLGLTLLFRHDIALLTFLACLSGALMLNATLKDKIGYCCIYASLPLAAAGAVFLWLHHIGALYEAYRSLILFPRVFCAGEAAIPFPGFCFDVSMMMHKACNFIQRNQFYIPMIVNAVSAVFIFSEILSKKKLEKRGISLLILLFLGVFYIQQMIVRADAPHLAAAFPPCAILFSALFGYDMKYRNLFLKFAKTASIFFISCLMALYFYANSEFLFREIYRKAFIKKTIRPVQFKEGIVYVPDDERDNVISLINYIKDNTNADEKIYIGSLNHSVPQYGWCDLIYFLTGRMPAVKYYEMHPGLQNSESIQREMIMSLKRDCTRVLLLREFKSDTVPLGVLDIYIRKDYTLDKIIGSYHIYVSKK